MLSQLPTALCLLLCSATRIAASSLVTFSDANCQKSQTRLAGENGYPDGACTNIAEIADGTYQSFMFTVLDDGCTPTIYQSDATSDTCSGAAYIAYISRCYNTSWVYYSIDGCTPVTTTATSLLTSSTSSTSSASSASSTSIATYSVVSGGAIAGAVVGSVCGLGVIAAVSAYFFWFRPKQREKKRREIEESGVKDAAGAARRKDEEEGKAHLISMHGSAQQSHEMQSVPDVFEAPGDNRAAEIGNDGEVPVELPGDHDYTSSGNSSDHISNRDQNPRR
ncbi:hypothetical protein diail_5668 [Diaporthe ilicicola]|nr:hypothetical protein diail_5668 [Diaporthe ilicicola]